jgi:4-amino-4-deoxy-L-arabinose transferase-like glycosyltransferase
MRERPGRLAGPALVVLAASVTILLRSWEGDVHRDEVLYAAVAKGLGTHGTWLDLYLGDDPYWNKPPLDFWLVAAAYRLLGPSSLSSRLFPALFAVLTCVALYALGKRLFDERVALIAALALATTPRFLHTGASLNHDTAVTLGTLVSLLCYLRGQRRADFVLAGGAWGLAVMAKGAFGLLGPLVYLLYLTVHRRLRAAFSGDFLLSLAVGAAVCVPWHLYAIVHWGPEYLHTYLGREIVERMQGRLWPGEANDSYFIELLRDDWPWLLFTAAGVVTVIRRARRGDRNAPFVLAWALGYLAALHLSAFHRGQYLMHFYPPAALLAALGVTSLVPVRWVERLPRVATAGFAAAGVALLVLPIHVHSYRADALRELRDPIDHHLPDRTASLVGYKTNVHHRAASLFFLDRDMDTRSLADIKQNGAPLVITERKFAPELEAAGLDAVHTNARYVLFHRR